MYSMLRNIFCHTFDSCAVARNNERKLKGGQQMKKPVWNVIYYNRTESKIVTVNIFEHSRFWMDVQKAGKKSVDKEAFSKALHSALFYYFCGKCEWEVLIAPLGCDRASEIKVDIYWQVRNNWDIFVDYTWNALKKQVPAAKEDTT